jgi:hypothetical protein
MVKRKIPRLELIAQQEIGEGASYSVGPAIVILEFCPYGQNMVHPPGCDAYRGCNALISLQFLKTGTKCSTSYIG